MMVISNKVCSGERLYKYFIGYKVDYYKIRPFSIMLPQMIAYVRRHDETKWMDFLVENVKDT